MSMLNFFKGFAVTFGKLNHASKSGKVVTTSYPEEKRDKPPRLHGRHVLNRYDDGMEKCIGCELCASVVQLIAFMFEERTMTPHNRLHLVNVLVLSMK